MRGCSLASAALVLVIGCGPAVPGNPNPPPVVLSNNPTETQGGASTGLGPHLESGGTVVVEAEHFTRAGTNAAGNRDWHLQQGSQAGPTPDPDGYHGGASNDAYLELLPDTRVTHSDALATGSFYDDGNGAWLEYEIDFETPGTYYVWGRIYSSGTEDNGIHVAVDGDIPATGRKMQWCGPNDWKWSNAQRDSGGDPCGRNGTIMVVVPTAGLHTISFHQREDGFEFDRFLMTTDGGYQPSGAGPQESARTNP